MFIKEIIAMLTRALNHAYATKLTDSNANKNIKKIEFMLNLIDTYITCEYIENIRKTSNNDMVNFGDLCEIAVKAMLGKKQVLSKARENDIKTNRVNNEIKAIGKDLPEIEPQQLDGKFIYILTYDGLFTLETKFIKQAIQEKNKTYMDFRNSTPRIKKALVDDFGKLIQELDF